MARAESEESMSSMQNLTNNIHVMLVGPVGAGKSSLINSLKQLCKSSDGSLPCDYSYIPPAGGGMLGGHTLIRQTVDSINTLTFTNNSGWHDWSDTIAVEGLTAQIRGEKAIDDIDRTVPERDSTRLKHPIVPHLAFSKVNCIVVVVNGQGGIEGIENHHALVEICRKNARRRPSFVITHKDTMSVEQIEHMKTALGREDGIDPDKIFFIENVTAPIQDIVDFEWKSRLCKFLAVCAVDGKVGADFHRMRENSMLRKVEGQTTKEKSRIENEIVDAKHELETMNIRATKLQLAQKQLVMLNSELKHNQEMHLLKTECNIARQIIRETSKLRGWEYKWHQLLISELQEKLLQSTTFCDSLIDTKASLQTQLKDEQDTRNITETTLTEEYNNLVQTQHVYKQRESEFENEPEQIKIEYERRWSNPGQKVETKPELKHKREPLKLRRKKKSHTQSEEQKKMKGQKKSLRKKFPVLEASFPKLKSDELLGATSRVHVHEQQTHTQNTEEEEKGQEQEERGKKDYIVTESLHHKTDEVNVKPVKMECCKRVGVQGGKIQLDSFGIELEIPPGAIDSEAPLDISLRVLTDTPNLGNSDEEMLVCFGVQCLAPDDLILKLPVTYTIPHCAVIAPYNNVKAVLYTGGGEYSPDAVVKERTMLSSTGTPSCIITKHKLKLKMDHLSWVKITLRIKTSRLFFPKKKMCCRPFKQKDLALQKTPVIIYVHLYDDIKGNSELVKSQEEKQELIPAYMEQQVLIRKSSVDLKMTCYVKKAIMGGPTVVSFDKLMSGTRICEVFEFVFCNQSDREAVSLKIGQKKKQNLILFRLEDRRGSACPQYQGRQVDFDEKLKDVAKGVVKHAEVDDLGKALGFKPDDIQRYFDANMKHSDVSIMGTLSMLRAWRKKQTKATECEALKGALREAGQIRLADELFGTS